MLKTMRVNEEVMIKVGVNHHWLWLWLHPEDPDITIIIIVQHIVLLRVRQLWKLNNFLCAKMYQKPSLCVLAPSDLHNANQWSPLQFRTIKLHHQVMTELPCNMESTTHLDTKHVS